MPPGGQEFSNGHLQSPYEQPITGLDAIKRMWEQEREGPDEVFTLATGIVAVDDARSPCARQVSDTAVCGQ
jgi:hypothetical protein